MSGVVHSRNGLNIALQAEVGRQSGGARRQGKERRSPPEISCRCGVFTSKLLEPPVDFAYGLPAHVVLP